MKLEDIFTAEELALIDSGEYKPGRDVLDAKLDLCAAIEREACARIVDDAQPFGIIATTAAAIRARGDNAT